MQIQSNSTNMKVFFSKGKKYMETRETVKTKAYKNQNHKRVFLDLADVDNQMSSPASVDYR